MNDVRKREASARMDNGERTNRRSPRQMCSTVRVKTRAGDRPGRVGLGSIGSDHMNQCDYWVYSNGIRSEPAQSSFTDSSFHGNFRGRYTYMYEKAEYQGRRINGLLVLYTNCLTESRYTEND